MSGKSMNMTGIKTATVNLRRGVLQGSVSQTECVVREGVVGDLLDASANGKNDVEVGLRMTLRRVVRIGDLPGPLEPSLVRNMTTHDLDLIRGACNKIDAELNGKAKTEEEEEEEEHPF